MQTARKETPAETKARCDREDRAAAARHFATARPKRKRGMEIAAHLAKAFPGLSAENASILAQGLQRYGVQMWAHQEGMCNWAHYVTANQDDDYEDTTVPKIMAKAQKLLDTLQSKYWPDDAKERAAGCKLHVETLYLELIIPGYRGDSMRGGIVLF